MKRRYNHGGPHMNIPRHPDMPVISQEDLDKAKGTITATDDSISAKLNRAANKITNFSMAPGGSTHGAPTQLIAEMTGIPSALRLAQSYKNVKNEPSGKNILAAAGNTVGVIPFGKILTGAAKGVGPLLRKADDALAFMGGTKIAKGFKAKKIANAMTVQNRQTGGYMDQMERYNTGGESLSNIAAEEQQAETVPGGVVSPIPNSDAVEFIGNKHDESGMGSKSGILLDDKTEVEDGETMDKVTVSAKNGGQRKDYFFSDHLKKGGMSYADHHKKILQDGGSQEDIDLLARMQEHAAGRDVSKIASTGGQRYKKGGAKEDALKVEGAFEQDGTVYDSAGRILYQDLNMDGIDDQTQGITTYNNTVNNVTRTIMENKDIADQVKKKEEETNTTLDRETNTFEDNDQYPLVKGKEMTDRQKDFHRKRLDRGFYWDPETESYKKGPDPNATDSESESEDKKSNTSTLNKMEEKKKKDNLTVASDVYLSDYGDIPGYQPGVNHNDMQYYMDDAELQKYITGHEDFGAEWMSNINPEVLKLAGITDYSQMNDPAFVLKYQKAWNKLNPENKIQEDSKFGEQTIRTGFKAGDAPEEVPEDPEETPETDPDDPDPTDPEKKKKKRDWSGALVNAAQFLPAAMAFLEKPDYMDKADLVKPGTIIPERMAKVRLDRVDFNDQLARNANDANALNRFIETSGGGPASMINRMASYSKKQDADMKIKAQEARANTAIANQEASLEAQRRATNAGNALNASQANAQSQQRASIENAKNKMTVDEFNAAAKAATKDRRLMAVDNAVKGIASMRKDKLAYDAQERMARAISGQTGVYNREAYSEDLIAAGYNVGDDDYNSLMTEFNKRNKPVIPPKKEKEKKEEESTLARMGGYKKKMRRYGK